MIQLKIRSTWGLLFLAGLLVMPTAGRAQDGQCQAYEPVRRLATGNAFSPTPANTLEELQAAFVQYRADIVEVLRESGFQGRAEDVLEAVARGAVEEDMIGKGEQFRWMAFRDKGRPMSKPCVSWQGMKTMDVWKLVVESVLADEVVESTFYVPKVCLNLALFKDVRVKIKEPPKCRLEVTRDCSSRSFKVSAAGSSSDIEVTVRGPGQSQPQPISSTYRSGDLRWSLPYGDGYGSYEFSAAADYGPPEHNRRGEAMSCSARHEVATCPETLSCQATVSQPKAAVGEEFEVTVEVSVQETAAPDVPVKDEDVRLEVAANSGPPLGSPSRVDSGPRTVTYRLTHSQDKAGDYTYQASAKGGSEGPASCSAAVKVTQPRWTLRLFGGTIDADDEVRQDLGDLASGTIERRKYHAGRGQALGVSLEYHLNPRIGFEVAALDGDSELSFVFDTESEWEMDKEDLDLFLITGGVNFHLTPNSKVDFYLGPILGIVNYGDVNLRALGRSFNHDFDNDEAVGLNLGVGIPACLRKHCWSFYGGLRILESSAEVDESPSFDLTLDPLIATAGVAYRF